MLLDAVRQYQQGHKALAQLCEQLNARCKGARRNRILEDILIGIKVRLRGGGRP